MVKRWWVSVAALAASAAAPASDFPPATNNALLAGAFALPAGGDTAVAGPVRGEFRAALHFINEWESIGVDGAGNCPGPECVVVDAEHYRLGLRYRRGLAPGWDWSLELPVVAQAGGFLDPSIERWHGWFGLPNNGRQRHAQGGFGVRYARDGTVLLAVDQPGAGIGDLRLGLGRALGPAVLRGQLKLPTGDADALREGNPGGALWLDAALHESAAWRAYATGGVSFNARGGVLPELQNRTVPFGAFGAALSATDALQLHVQLYLHGRLYHDTELRNLYRYGAVLGFGGRYRFSPDWSLDVGMLEDADVNVSPDFDFQLVLTYKK